MKITLNPNRHRRGITLLVLILVFVIFLVVIGGIAIIMIQAVKKLVPPPKDPDGVTYYPRVGSKYAGGTVIGTGTPKVAVTNSPGQWSIYICADDSPNPAAWTNVIWWNTWTDWNTFQSDLGNLTVSNLQSMDPACVTNAPHRFYNILYAPGD